MQKLVTALTLLFTSAATLTGCGTAATRAPAAPPVVAKATAKPVPEKPPAPVEEVAAPTPIPSPAADENDGIRKASRPPQDLITAPDVLFVFNFKSSAVGEAAQKRCESEAGDPASVRACLETARGKVPVESIQFAKDASGAWWWVTYNRYRGNLLKWHKVQFQPGDQTKDSIVLNLIGKDKGIAPMPRVPKSMSIELPNDYSIVVQDPEFGAMTYDAKIGMLAPD